MIMDRSQLLSIASSAPSPTEDGKTAARQLSLFRADQSDAMSDVSTQSVNSAKYSSSANLKKSSSQSSLLEKLQEEKPKRPLSSYNIFFKDERERLIEMMNAPGQQNPSEKLGFAAMARTVAGRWREVEPTQKAYYNHLAALDQRRYKIEMDKWKAKKASIEAGETHAALQLQEDAQRPEASAPEDLLDSMADSVQLPMMTNTSSGASVSWGVAEYHERCQRLGLYKRLAINLGTEETSDFIQMFRK